MKKITSPILPRVPALLFILIPAILFSSSGITLQGRVTRVVDGDTIRVKLDSGGVETVRFLGVDAPESYVKRHGYTEFSGEKASEYIKTLLQGKHVRIVSPGKRASPEKDRYGRILGFVYQGDRDICALLLKQGLARVYTQKTSPRYDEFLSYENEAKRKGIGIWNADAERDYYRRQFRQNRNRYLILWFWENDRDYLRQILQEQASP